MLMKFIFTFTLAMLLCCCGANEDKTENASESKSNLPTESIANKSSDSFKSKKDTSLDNFVEVRIEVTDPMHLSLYENGDPMLNGALKVTLVNHGELPIRLDPINIHRLKFTEKSTREVFNIIHECDCFKQRYTRIAAGDSIVKKWNGWIHEGGPFTPPVPGEYLLSFGVDDFSKSKIDYEIQNNFSRNRRKAIKLCKEKFAAIKSNKYESESILINLK
jgi:hypothetical protein